MRMISDPANPSAFEVEAWAYDAEAEWPHQEWDLFLSWKVEEDLYLQLAADAKCPKQGFFRHLLHYIVGKAISSEYKTYSKINTEAFIQKGKRHKNKDIQQWAARAAELVRDPSRFEYDDWCGGKLAGYKF